LLLALCGMVHRRRLVVYRWLVMLRMLHGLVTLGLVHRRLVMLCMLHGPVARHLGERRLRGVGRLGIFIIFIKIPFPLDIFLLLFLTESALLLSLGY